MDNYILTRISPALLRVSSFFAKQNLRFCSSFLKWENTDIGILAIPFLIVNSVAISVSANSEIKEKFKSSPPLPTIVSKGIFQGQIINNEPTTNPSIYIYNAYQNTTSEISRELNP